MRPRSRTRSVVAVVLTFMVAVSTVVLSAVPSVSVPNAGSLDPTFDGDGYVTTSFNEFSEAYAVAVQDDGKIVVAGRAWSGDNGFSFVRYMRDGSLDNSFGTGGRVTNIFVDATTARSVKAMVIQDDGKIVGVGGVPILGPSGEQWGLVRLNVDGSPDATFGSDGIVTPGLLGHPEGAAVQADGKLVVVGRNEQDAVVTRYNTDGSLDASFGAGGVAVGPTHPWVWVMKDVIIQPDGKIVAGGQTNEATPAQSDAVVLRFNTDGTPDTTFGVDGVVITDLGLAAINAVALQSDGKIAAVGYTTTGDVDWALLRYLPDGSLDTTMGTTGLVTSGFGDWAQAADLVLEPDGKIIVTGWVGRWSSPLTYDFLLGRYLPDGSLDSGFGTAGIVRTNPAIGTGRSIARQSDGRVVVAGISNGPQFAAARFISRDNMPPVAVADGPFSVVPGTTVSGNVLANDSDGDGDDLTAVKVSDSSQGTVTLDSDGSFVYTADIGFTGTDSFTYLAHDGLDDSNVVEVSFDEAPNAPPVAVADGPFTVAAEGSISGKVLDNDSDADGHNLTAIKMSDPSQGTVTLDSDGSFVYTADVGFSGTDSFTYVANDGLDDSNLVEVSFNDVPNTPPVANPDGPFTMEAGSTFASNVLDNDSDADGDDLVAVKVADPAHGAVALSSDGAFTYTPEAGYVGSDSFSYKANDGSADSTAVGVTFVVEAPPVAPVGDSVGLVDPATGIWHLRSDAGTVDSFYYGNPGDVPVVGDWDCDGVDTPGLFRQSDAFAYLKNRNSTGIADVRFFFGDPSDVPLAGDFNGDGCDTLSIYRPAEARFYIVNKLGTNDGGLGTADFSFLFGNPGDKPVVGDWDGDGIDEVGLHRESTGFFYWRDTLTTGNADGEFFFGDPGDRFVAGDWGIVDETDTPAVYRPDTGILYFRHTLTQGNADDQFPWSGAESGWLPIAGAFTP